MNPKIKNIIIAVVALVVLIAGYLVFFNKKEVAPLSTTGGVPISSNTTANSGASQSQLGDEFLQILLNLRTIQLDDSTFSSPSFNSLRDYTITLVPEGNEGRPNPFAPIGVDTFVDNGSPTDQTNSTQAGQVEQLTPTLSNDLNTLPVGGGVLPVQ